jgi:hypothetical protein
MKVNQLGTLATLAIIGVVASFTAACSGSPLKPTPANQLAGDGSSATSVTLTTFQQEVAVAQICTAQTVTFDDNGNEVPDVSTDSPAMTCEPAPAADQPAAEQPQEDGVVADAPSMDTARFARSLHR